MSRIRLRFGGYQGPDSIHTAAANAFGSALIETQGGAVDFELVQSVQDWGFKAGQLPELTATGELDLCYISSIRLTETVPEFSLFELPFLIGDRASLFAALDGEAGRLLSARIEEETPLKILGFWDNGFRHISNCVRPIRTPEDCRGLAIRTQMSALAGETFRALGFEPTGTDINDFLDTIATDRFQAQDNPLTSIYIFGMHEHHRYITMSGHFFGLSLFLCNRRAFQGWPAEVQASVRSAAQTATARQRQLAAEQDDVVLPKLRANGNEVTFLQPQERQAFKDAVAPLQERYRGELGPGLFELLGV